MKKLAKNMNVVNGIASLWIDLLNNFTACAFLMRSGCHVWRHLECAAAFFSEQLSRQSYLCGSVAERFGDKRGEPEQGLQTVDNGRTLQKA